MKLANFFLMTVLVGTLGVLGCSDDTTNAAGSGGSGTAGTGGSDLTCMTAQEVCANCDSQGAIPACESAYDTCLATPPSGNYCDKCSVIGLQACGI